MSAPDEVAVAQQPRGEDGLTDRERAILDFEARPWPQAGPKEGAIRMDFDISPARYYQLLNRLIDLPAARAYKPALLALLERERHRKRLARQSSQPQPDAGLSDPQGIIAVG